MPERDPIDDLFTLVRSGLAPRDDQVDDVLDALMRRFVERVAGGETTVGEETPLGDLIDELEDAVEDLEEFVLRLGL